MKRWSVRNSRVTLTAQLHQLVSNRSEKQMNDRNNRSLFPQHPPNSAYSLTYSKQGILNMP